MHTKICINKPTIYCICVDIIFIFYLSQLIYFFKSIMAKVRDVLLGTKIIRLITWITGE